MSDGNDAGMAGGKRPCNGPLAFCFEGFAAFLGGEGYTRVTMEDKCRTVADLDNWLARCKIGLDALDEEQLNHFHATRCRPGHVRRGDVATGQLLFRYLRGLECIPTLLPKADGTALGDLTQEFGRHLSSERGLSPATLSNYLPIVRRFLTERFGNTAMRLDELQPVDIHRFIVRRVQTGSRHSAQLVVTALRAFLRFLQQRGTIATDLASAVPGVANWRLSHLPKSLPPEQVERMLVCCDRGTSVGQRDYAILLFLARLGLRAGEIVSLTLDDLDWEQGEVLIHGKGQRLGRLPLPTDVGAALADYFASRSSSLLYAAGLYPHASAVTRPKRPRGHRLCRLSRAQACRVESGLQRRPPATPFSGHRSAAPRRFAHRDRTTLAP